VKAVNKKKKGKSQKASALCGGGRKGLKVLQKKECEKDSLQRNLIWTVKKRVLSRKKRKSEKLEGIEGKVSGTHNLTKKVQKAEAKGLLTEEAGKTTLVVLGKKTTPKA